MIGWTGMIPFMTKEQRTKTKTMGMNRVAARSFMKDLQQEMRRAKLAESATTSLAKYRKDRRSKRLTANRSRAKNR